MDRWPVFTDKNGKRFTVGDSVSFECEDKSYEAKVIGYRQTRGDRVAVKVDGTDPGDGLYCGAEEEFTVI